MTSVPQAPQEPSANQPRPLRSDNKTLNGKYLSLSNGTVGVFPANSTPLSVYPRSDAGAGAGAGANAKVELHTYPIGIVDHALALVGRAKDSLRSLTDLTNPAATAFPAGTSVDWTGFTMSGGGVGGGDARAGSSQLSYVQQGGKWLAFPAKTATDWTVSWFDGESNPLRAGAG